MSEPSERGVGTPPPPSEKAGERAVIVEELQRRLRILDEAEEATFGRFTSLDWIVCVAAFVVAPLLLIWWGARL